MIFEHWQLPFIILCLLSGAWGAYYVRLKHREKMEIIKKGEQQIGPDRIEEMKLRALSRGILLVAAGVGFMAARLLIHFFGFEAFETYATSMLLFAGMGSLIFYRRIKNI